MSMQETFESPKRDNLFAANQVMPVVADKLKITVAATRGTLVTSAGAKATAASGAHAVLAEDVEAGKVAAVYLTGEFNAAALAEATGIDVAAGTVIANRIFVKSNIEA